MLAELYKTKPELKERLARAAGYATFKQTDVNLFMLASGRGYGVVHDNQTGKDTFMSVASLGTGVGMGVKDMRIAFVFHDPRVMQQFVEKGWQFGGKGDASAKYKQTASLSRAAPRPMSISKKAPLQQEPQPTVESVASGGHDLRQPHHLRGHGNLPVHRKRPVFAGDRPRNQVLERPKTQPVNASRQNRKSFLHRP